MNTPIIEGVTDAGVEFVATVITDTRIHFGVECRTEGDNVGYDVIKSNGDTAEVWFNLKSLKLVGRDFMTAFTESINR